MSEFENKILVVGQIPPPWGGQAVMIQKLLDADFDSVDLHFVPMAFSADMDEIGRFRWKKLLRLPVLVARIWKVRFSHQCKVLYYPPGGESITAIVRDIVVLLSCRFLFHRVVFHVHAGGFTDVVEITPFPVRILARWAYRKPDVVIQLTEKSPPDGDRIRARRIVHVPNGLADDGVRFVGEFRRSSGTGPVRLLFVGVVSRSKGVMVLLEACSRLKERGSDFVLQVVGRFHSPEFEAECRVFSKAHALDECVEFLGVRTGDEKWGIFCNSDIFCFPSHFESENQSLVILEAMQFGLPCVASDWRSMSTMVEDGVTGYVVPVSDPEALSQRIAHLIHHPELREKMGARAREVFLERYTDAVWRSKMEVVLREI